MTLTTIQLEHIETHIEEILPSLLKRNPAIVTTIEGILAQHFPRRDEFARLLDKVDASIEALDIFRKDVDQRFEQVDQRFEQVDQRFEQVDQRFEQVDQRFDSLTNEMNERFEQVDKRFEQADQRFEKLEKTQLVMRRDIAKLNAGQENIIKRMDGMEAWLKLMFGDSGNQIGSTSEDLVAAALRYGLKEDDIDADTIRLRQPLRDPEGLVFRPGYKSEIDIIAQNGHVTIFEVKTTRVKPGEVEVFAMKRDLFVQQNLGIDVKGLLIVPCANETLQQECDAFGIRLLT
ncbi:MAG: hypothetical protein AAF639_03480 [Chloroflexota bacterium]